jgi:hypothetical protein
MEEEEESKGAAGLNPNAATFHAATFHAATFTMPPPQ